MRNGLTIILILVFVLWQVIVRIIEHRARAQQEQRMREVAAERERQIAARRAAAPPAGAQPGAAPRSAPVPATEEPGTLAERRRAQLDELRRRQAERGATVFRPQPGPGHVARTGAAPAPAPPPVARPPPVLPGRWPVPVPVPRPQPAPVPPATVARPRPRPAPAPTRVPPVARVPRPEPPAPVFVRPPRPEPLEEAVEQRVAAGRRVAARAEDEHYAAHVRRRHPLLGGRRLADTLRRMVVLKEILDPPVSIRQGQPGDRI